MVGRTFLGRYEAIRPLGEGGMGRVYLARQIDLDRQVVVKVMHDHLAADKKFRERFQRELRLMAKFQHPYVVALYDSTRLDLYDDTSPDAEGLCIVMEYVRGITLDTLLHRNGRISPPRAGRLLGQLCEALQAAHSQGIIHRDLKPANLMVVDPDSPYEKIKVMDFGLAKLVDGWSRSMKVSDTGSEFAVGTPGYISPEQVRGDDMDRRSDLYSVGVILFELLTGRLPFTGDETMDVLLAHAQAPPPSFAEAGVSGVVAPAVEAVVLSCLAKQPAERPNTALELADRYEVALAEDAPAGVVPEPAYAGTPRHHDKAAEKADTPPPASEDHQPGAVVHQLEAWMPEAIATYKLRGFVHDVGGEVIESVPGLIRVRLGARGSVYWMPGQGPLSWLGLGRRFPMIDMELRLERGNPGQQSLLRITVVMSSDDTAAADNPQWRARCQQVFCDLRAYLMGQAGAVTG
jgi:serine/threonine-protein kinase